MSWRGASWNWKKFSPVPETGLKTKNTVHTVGRIYITVWTVFFMDRKLKIWEMALLFGVLCAIMGGMWLDREQTQLANQVIRLHVIANSDSDGDQALKLKVRDGVLAQAEQLYPKGASLEQAAQALERNLAVLAAAGQAVVEQEGAGYPVRAELTRCWFPTKEYDGFAPPAGEYTALRVTIGEGAGRNWWCVAYPPLCLGAATQTVEQAALTGLLDTEEAMLITGEDEGYVLKFKAIELLEEWRALFQS